MAESITNVLGVVGMKTRGAYNSETSYEKLNVVTYNGSSYCAKTSTQGNLPTDTIFWDLIAEKGDKGDKGDTPIKGTDYYTAADKAELESTLASDVSDEVTEQLSDLTSATPLVASSTSGMTDTTRVYVNTTDGHWYWYNGTVWTDGGVYQASSIDDFNLNRINNNYANINKITVTPTNSGYIQYSNGVVSPTESAGHTDYIIVDGYDKINYRTHIDSGGAEIAFYDINKTYIQNISINGTGGIVQKWVNVPSNAYYAILSYYGTQYASTSFITLYNTNGIYEQINNLNLKLQFYDQLKQNIIITEKPNLYGYVTTNGLVLDPTNENARHTDYINIKGYNKIEYKTWLNNSGNEISFYDINKEYLDAISIAGNSSNTTKQIDVPESAYYVILSCYDSQYFESSYIKVFSENYNLKTNILNKNILVFGDSITECTNISVNDSLQTTSYSVSSYSPTKWPILINNKYSLKELRCYARSGATYRLTGMEDPRYSVCNQVLIAINDKNNPNNVFKSNSFTPDIVIFSAGTNDDSIGTYEEAMSKTVYESDDHTININATLDNLNRNRMVEAARYCFMKIKNEWPLAQIFVILPIQRMSKNMYLSNCNIELKKIAKKYGAIIIDGTDNGITQEGNVYQGVGTTLADGLHPNQNGQYLMTRQIIQSLNNNYVDLNIFE